MNIQIETPIVPIEQDEEKLNRIISFISTPSNTPSVYNDIIMSRSDSEDENEFYVDHNIIIDELNSKNIYIIEENKQLIEENNQLVEKNKQLIEEINAVNNENFYIKFLIFGTSISSILTMLYRKVN